MKIILPLLLVVMSVSCAVAGDEPELRLPSAGGMKLVWSNGFERLLPGQWPKGWRHLWGKFEGDAFALSNEQAGNGRQSLLFERREKGHYGLSCILPKFSAGITRMLAFSFMIDGTGHNASFSFEIRQGNRREFSLGHIAFGGNRLSIMPATRNRKQIKTVGTYEQKKWYRVVFIFPPDKSGKLEALLFRQGEQVWQRVGRAEVDGAEYKNIKVFLTLTTRPGLTGYLFYLDDMRLYEVKK